VKIGDPLAAALPTPTAQAVTPRKAGAWQAQLERAWLDSWQGDRPERQRTPGSPGAPGTGSPTPSATPDRPELADLRERQSDERGSRLPAQFNPKPINPSHESNQPMVAPRGLMTSPIEAPAGTTSSRAKGSGLYAEAVPQAPSARLAQQPLTRGRGEAAPAEGEAQHGAASDQVPGPTPARSSLQVAVANGTAQVTLRDAALNANEAARIPQAIAHQLLESGLESVRLYVNGRLSQHDRSPSRQRTPPDIGNSTDPLHITPPERK
jgi:hypothetical protein